MGFDVLMLIAILAREECARNVASDRLAHLVEHLYRCAKQLSVYAERACDRPLTPTEKNARKAVERQAHELCAELGVPVSFNDDPRGFSVKLRLPNGASNDWGGETWGLG